MTIAEVFIPHGHCYLWKPELVELHVVSDALIALAYYSIPHLTKPVEPAALAKAIANWVEGMIQLNVGRGRPLTLRV